MNTAPSKTGSPRRLTFTLLALGAGGLLALIASSEPFIAVAMAAGAAILPIGIFATEILMLAWLATGPTLSTWLDFDIGPGPALTPDRAILLALLPALAWKWFRRPGTILPLGRLELLMGFFFVVALISALLGGGSTLPDMNADVLLMGAGLRRDLTTLVLSYGLPFVGFFLAKNLLRTNDHVRWLLWVYIGIGLFVGGVGILQYFTGIDIFTPTRMRVSHLERATGTLGSAPEFGLVVGGPLLVAGICFLRSRFTPERFILGLTIAIILVSVVLAKTRAIWVGLALGLAVAAFYEPKLRRRLFAAGFVLVIGLVVAWPFLAETEFVRGRVLSMTPIYSRVVLIATSINMFLHNPIFGLGFGRYTFAAEKYDYMIGILGLTPYHAYSSGLPHNEYLHILVLLGLVGFIPYLAILALFWRNAVRHHRNRTDLTGASRDMGLIFLSCFAMYLMGASTSDAMGLNYASLQVYVFAGAIEGMRCRSVLFTSDAEIGYSPRSIPGQ